MSFWLVGAASLFFVLAILMNQHINKHNISNGKLLEYSFLLVAIMMMLFAINVRELDKGFAEISSRFDKIEKALLCECVTAKPLKEK